MTKKRVLAALLAAVLLLTVGCRKAEDEYKKEEGLLEYEDPLTSGSIVIEPEIPEPEPEPEQEAEDVLSPYFPENELPENGVLTGEWAFLNDLSAEQVPWGPGTNFDADGTPTACRLLQADYGSYDADFVRNDAAFAGKVFLTFDEGYENGYTASILDTLKEKDVSAVFFVTLPYVKSEPELVKRMIDEGHIVGNHSANHPNMTTETPSDAYDEVADLHSYVKENFGYEMFLFRPPEGAFSERTLALLQKMGYRSVFWSFAYKDWDPENQYDYDTALAKATGSLHSGEIFLLHAVSSTNAAILGDFIDTVRAAGYTFERYEQ